MKTKFVIKRYHTPLRKNTFTVQTSSVFTQQIKQHSISSEEVMVSFNVKSLFTSIPVDLVLAITNERLQRDQNLAERTNLSVDNILRLSDFSYSTTITSNMMATSTNSLPLVLFQPTWLFIWKKLSKLRSPPG